MHIRNKTAWKGDSEGDIPDRLDGQTRASEPCWVWDFIVNKCNKALLKSLGQSLHTTGDFQPKYS